MKKPSFAFIDHLELDPMIGYFQLKGKYYSLDPREITDPPVTINEVDEEEFKDFVSNKSVFPMWLDPVPEILPVYNFRNGQTNNYPVVSQTHIDFDISDDVIVLIQLPHERIWVRYNHQEDIWEFLDI